MTATDGAYRQWLSQAQIAEQRLTAEQHSLLQAAWTYRTGMGSRCRRKHPDQDLNPERPR